MSEKKLSIYEAISAIMAAVEPIAKDRQGHGYKFRGIDDTYEALQALLAKYGVFTVPTVLSERTEERTSTNNKSLIYRILTIKYVFYASDASFVEAIVVGEGMDSGDKASNKAMSVAHKYALLQVFCIPTVESKDPEEDSHEVVKQTPTQDAGQKDKQPQQPLKRGAPPAKPQAKQEEKPFDASQIYKGTPQQKIWLFGRLDKWPDASFTKDEMKQVHDALLNHVCSSITGIVNDYLYLTPDDSTMKDCPL